MPAFDPRPSSGAPAPGAEATTGPSNPLNVLELQKEIIQAEKDHRAFIEARFDVASKPELAADLAKLGEPAWDKIESISIPPARAQAIARQLFKSSKAQPGDRIVLEATPETLEVVAEVLSLCKQNNVEVTYDFRNFAREAVFAMHLPDQEGSQSLQAFAQARLDLYSDVKKSLRVITNPDPAIRDFTDPDKSDKLDTHISPRQQRFRNGDLHYIVTYLPTAIDAARDGMDHKSYLKLYLEACEQPWEAIEQAQAKLVEKFNKANRLRITNNDGTDITFDITGQTFANSVVAKNLPGAEIFSAPLREGVNGTIVAKGKFQFRNSGTIEDITLVFEKGRIVDFDARVGKEALAKILNSDEGQGDGARFLGEIGIGGNPHLRRHLTNSLLVEKVSGSFHVAAGSCYSYTVYEGTPVSLQNGNRSVAGIHWDITTLLRGKGGNMELMYDTDEGEVRETVQLNGDWVVDGTEVLNKGWGAMPAEARPEWWIEGCYDEAA